MNERLLPVQRIRYLAEFQQIYSSRQRFAGRFYVLYYRGNPEGYRRLGVVASKRNLKTAVLRNRAKRVAREAFRHLQLKLSANDIVIVARADSAVAEKRELRACINQLLMRLVAR